MDLISVFFPRKNPNFPDFQNFWVNKNWWPKTIERVLKYRGPYFCNVINKNPNYQDFSVFLSVKIILRKIDDQKLYQETFYRLRSSRKKAGKLPIFQISLKFWFKKSSTQKVMIHKYTLRGLKYFGPLFLFFSCKILILWTTRKAGLGENHVKVKEM